jgi:type IV secretory pathway VirJ component
MATVTETYILEQDEGKTEYPASAKSAWQSLKDSGAVVSETKIPIVDPAEVIAGKTRSNVTIVWRSAEDRTNAVAAAQANTVLQSYFTSSNTRKINRVIS